MMTKDLIDETFMFKLGETQNETNFVKLSRKLVAISDWIYKIQKEAYESGLKDGKELYIKQYKRN